jgi:hypothetical protein
MKNNSISWLSVARRWLVSIYTAVSEAEAFGYDDIQERRIFNLERKVAALSANQLAPMKNAAE